MRFRPADNFFNITRNFAYIGIMALGMMAVIITGGIDLSVGSVMGLVGVVCGLVLQAGHSWWLAVLAGLGAGALCGLVNGVLVAYVGLPSFVVTLGMLSVARSFAVVLSQNKMIYEFGPDGDIFKAIGGGEIARRRQPGLAAAGHDPGLRIRLPLHALGALSLCRSAATSRRPG